MFRVLMKQEMTMKTTLLATALAMVTVAPLVALAAQSAPASDRPSVTDGRGTTLQRDDSGPAIGMSLQPRLIGPYEVRHGLLPNGLTPNPFTYG